MTTVTRVSHNKKARYNPKYTVFGYVRRVESLIRSSPFHLFQSIPINITCFCVSYYQTQEYFETVNNENIKLSKYKTFIYKFHQGPEYKDFEHDHGLDNTTFGKLSISSTSQAICKWYLKINNIPKTPKRQDLCPFIIGIVSKLSSANKEFTCHLSHENYKFYAYEIDTKILGAHVGGFIENYGQKFKDNDIICIKLDLKRREIKYYKNGKSFGIAFDNIDIGEDIDYRLAVTIGHKYGEISILKFVERY